MSAGASALRQSVAAREPQQERSRATRARLLDSAVHCLAELGYQASTVAVVARRAGVSRGAAQHHFPTRDALFTAALEHVTAERAAAMQRQITAADGTAGIVRAVFDLYTDTAFRAALALWLAAAGQPSLRTQVVDLEARVGRQAHRAVVAMLDVDEQQPGVRALVQATLDLARGLGLATLLTDDSARRARIAAEWAGALDRVLPDASGRS